MSTRNGIRIAFVLLVVGGGGAWLVVSGTDPAPKGDTGSIPTGGASPALSSGSRSASSFDPAGSLETLIEVLLYSSERAHLSARELRERVSVGVLTPGDVATAALVELKQDVEGAEARFCTAAVTGGLLREQPTAPSSARSALDSYLILARKRAKGSAHHQLAGYLKNWSRSVPTHLVEQFTSKLMGASGKELRRSLESLLAEDSAAAYAALARTITYWSKHNLGTQRFGAVLDAVAGNEEHLRETLRIVMSHSDALQASLPSGTANGIVALGGAMLAWLSDERPAGAAGRMRLIDELLSSELPLTRPGAGILTAMALGAAGDGNPGAARLLSELHTGALDKTVRRTALVNIGNIGTVGEVVSAASPRYDSVPESIDEALGTITFFTALHNSLRRHPEEEDVAAPYYSEALKAASDTEASELVIEALLRHLVERPVAGTQEQLERLRTDSSSRVRRLAGKAADALKMRDAPR